MDQADGTSRRLIIIIDHQLSWGGELIRLLGLQKEDALKLWGHPTTLTDISSLFSRFCTADLKALPWSDQAPAVETSVIAKQLAAINELGFLTINSQPAVNSAKSDDKVFGWGPGNGYVYQKVCVFANAPHWSNLIIVLGLPRVLRQPASALSAADAH